MGEHAGRQGPEPVPDRGGGAQREQLDVELHAPENGGLGEHPGGVGGVLVVSGGEKTLDIGGVALQVADALLQAGRQARPVGAEPGVEGPGGPGAERGDAPGGLGHVAELLKRGGDTLVLALGAVGSCAGAVVGRGLGRAGWQRARAAHDEG